MPATIDLTLTAVRPPRESGDDLGPGAHALLMDSIRAVDPILGERLHGPTRPKPWALGQVGNAGQQTWRMQMHMLNDGLVAPTLAALSTAPAVVHLGSGRFVLDRIDGHDMPWSRLLDQDPQDRDRWRLRFLTPVLFRGQSGPGHPPVVDPIPSPGAVLGSLARRWDVLAPPELAGTETMVMDCVDRVAVTDLDLRTDTRLVRTGRSGRRGVTLRGSVGSIGYQLLGDQQHARVIGALLAFAQLAGVGDQTTKGFGVVTTSGSG